MRLPYGMPIVSTYCILSYCTVGLWGEEQANNLGINGTVPIKHKLVCGPGVCVCVLGH
jgi:hypothetical protein